MKTFLRGWHVVGGKAFAVRLKTRPLGAVGLQTLTRRWGIETTRSRGSVTLQLSCRINLGVALIVLCSALALHAQVTNYYVDEAVGNNSYDGLSDTVSGGNGPKFNVSAAISVATDGSAIQVDTGDYAESAWDSGTNSLTLSPQNDVNVCGSDLCGADTVGDGIPDWWRLEYYGTPTTTNAASCASCDPAGSGFSNLQAYLASIDPTNYFNNLTVAACFTNQYGIYGENFISVAPWGNQGVFYLGQAVTISNSIGTPVEVYDFYCNAVTNGPAPLTFTPSALGHYFIQVDGTSATAGYGDRGEFTVLPTGFNNSQHLDVGELPGDTVGSTSNRWVQVNPGFTRLQQGWATITTNNIDYDYSAFSNALFGSPQTSVTTLKVLNIPVDHLDVVTNDPGAPLVDQTNSMVNWVADVGLLYSNAAVAFTNSVVYEILNEPGYANYVFPDDPSNSNGAFPAAMAVSASVQAIQFVCPTCETWAPAAQGSQGKQEYILTNSYVIPYYSNVTAISYHSGLTIYGPVDTSWGYTNVLGVYGQNNELGSNDVLISSLYGGKPLEVDEMYPYSPSELGRTNSWWLTAVPAATYTGVPLNTWTWQLLTARFWKEIILMKGTGVRHLLTWIQLSDNQVGPNTNANPYVELESGGQDAYAGWDEYSGCCSIGAYNYDDISGIGPRTPYDGQMMLSWWLNGATSITNWLSGTSLNVVSELGSYNSGTPGLHFWEWQFANGTTNTFVWADEVTTVTTNLGVGLTDIFSNQWTGPIDMTPVIAWNWPQ